MLPLQVSSARQARGIILGMLLAVLLVIVGFSNAFGRAEPTGRYRPELLPAALDNGCYPLPAGVELDFPHQVRSDGDLEGRRRLVLQFDLMDTDQARAELVAAFTERGFRVVASADPAHVVLTRPEIGRVEADVTPLDVPDDAIVQGWIVLDLPVAELASDDPVCLDSASTKRFAVDGA